MPFTYHRHNFRGEAAPSFPIRWNTPRRKLAFILGNRDYESGNSLRNSLNDAKDMENGLFGIGFETTLGLNCTREEMTIGLGNFVGNIEPGDVVLFFFSGHLSTGSK